MSERVAIVGSRAHPNLELVRAYVRSLPAGTVVVTGGAEGVDKAAEEEASKRSTCFADHPVVFVPEYAYPFWGYAGRGRVLSARDLLLYRNTQIALNCTRMVVFPDGSRGGAWDAAREAVRFKRPVEVRWCSGEVQPFSKSIQRRIEEQSR